MSTNFDAMQEADVAANYKAYLELLRDQFIDDCAADGVLIEDSETGEQIRAIIYVLSRMDDLERLERNAPLPPTDPCYAKLQDGEPFFVLRGQDIISPRLIREWATLAASYGCPLDKVQIARATADRCEAWPNRKAPD